MMTPEEQSVIYQKCFEHTLRAMYVLNNNAEIIQANPIASALLGCTAEELFGKSLWTIIPEKYLTKAKVRWKEFLIKGCYEGVTKVMVHNAEVRYVEYSALASVIPNVHVVVLQDITQRRIELTEERHHYLNSIYPVGIFHADKIGRNIYINEKASELMGVTFEEAMKRGWEKNLHPDDSWVKDAWYNVVDSQGRINLEYRFVHDDGSIVWVQGQSVVEHDSKGNVIGHVGTLTDITKLRAAEEQIRLNQVELAHYSRVNSMGEMASAIAHELNQPLTAMANYAHGCIRRLQNISIEPEITDSIKQIAAQAERAGAIIHHLKDFLRKGEFQKTDCNINQCVENVLSILSSITKNQGVEIKTELDSNIPIIKADSITIEQVIVNLITNATEAMLEQSSENNLIIISSYAADSYVSLKVIDNGPGVSKTIEKTMFNPFITTKIRGMGIGLSLSQSIVEKHDGKLTYAAAYPTGSIFEIKLPY